MGNNVRCSMVHPTISHIYTYGKQNTNLCVELLSLQPKAYKLCSAKQKLQAMPSHPKAHPGHDKGLYREFTNVAKYTDNVQTRGYQAEQDKVFTSASCDRKNCLPVSRPFFSVACCSARLQAQLR